MENLLGSFYLLGIFTCGSLIGTFAAMFLYDKYMNSKYYGDE